jgi:hypothetical protein
MAAYNGWMGDYHVPDMAKPMATLSEAVSQYSDKRDDKAIGAAAATGKLSDAANEAFRRGKLKQGATLADLDDDRKAEVSKIMSRAAMNADTPEKWAQLQQSIQKRFPGEQLEPFEEREGLIAQFRDPYKERELDQRDKALRISEAKGNGSGVGGRPKLNVIDKKEIFEAEDSNANLESTVTNLQSALAANNKAYTGVGAGARADAVAKTPLRYLVGDETKDGANATLEFEKITSPEALQIMSSTLKGATTDFELKKYIDIFADVSAPPKTRQNAIERLIALAERKRELNASRINQIRAGTYYDEGGGSSDDPEAKPDPKEDPLGLR